MGARHCLPFAHNLKLNKWQPNHVYVICGPGSHERARSLYEKNQCQPAIPVPKNLSPELYPWPVKGKDVTISNLGSPDHYTEDLVFALLTAGASLVVNADQSSGQITVYRREELSNVA